LLAMAPCLPTTFSQMPRDQPVGAELARDDGLPANNFLPDAPDQAVGAELARDGALAANNFLPDAPRSNCRSEPARDGGVTVDSSLTVAPGSNCGSWLAGDGSLTGYEVLMVYISIPAVTAAIGFAFTASHLEKPQVTKGSCPFRTVPRLGSAYPRSGPASWARRDRPSLAVRG